MWFRNLQIYRLPENWGLTAEALAEKLAAHPFQPCGSQDMASRGWASPTKDDRFVMAVGGQFLIALAVEQKLLPSSVVNDVAADKAEAIEAQQGFKPGRKQMKEIKEAVLQELLPRAFSRRRKAFAWIDPAGGWLVIDAISPARAEEILDALRDSLDELPVQMVKTRLSPVSVMTDWLAANEAADKFTIDQDCELRAVTARALVGDDTDEGAVGLERKSVSKANSERDAVEYLLTLATPRLRVVRWKSCEYSNQGRTLDFTVIAEAL